MSVYMHPSGGKWWIPIAIALTSLAISGYGEYAHNDKDLTSKVAALEAHRQDDKSQLTHIQTQVDKLVEWALGTK